MGGKFQFDETRDAIGVNKLNKDERQQMLEKFKNAGGQVLSERELREQKREEARRRQARSSGGNDKKKRGEFADSGKKQGSPAMSAAKLAEKREKQLKGNTAKFVVRFKTFMAGLAPFSGAFAKPAFFKFLGLEVKQAVVEFNLLGNDLFLQDKSTGKTIARELDNRNPIYMEAMERLHSLYNASEYHHLMEYHAVSPDIDVPFSSIEEPLKSLYRKMYYLFPFQETLKKGFVTAIDIYKKENSLAPAEINALEQKKKKFLKDLKIVFEIAFPKIFALLCRIDGVNYPPYSAYFEKALGIQTEEKLGTRNVGESTSLASNISEYDEENAADAQSGESAEGGAGVDGVEEETQPESDPVKQSKEYKYGMSLMNAVDPETLRKKHDPGNRYHELKLNDRALLAFLYFCEFDRELSFVLTTKKIKLSVDYSGGKRDYKQILADIFNESRNIIQSFEKYYDAKKEYKEVEQAPEGSNYIEASKRREKSKARVDMEGRSIRGSINHYISAVAQNLALLVADMKDKQKIVENMDEPIDFESDLEGAKRLNGQPVKQCILEAYCYSLALANRLDSGDLYGGILEMTDEEMKSSFGKKLISGVSD